MPLSEDQARSLLQKAKERKPDITRQEASMLLKEANTRFDASQPQKEEKPTFQKVADFIGLGTVAKNIDTIASAPVVKKHTKEFEKYTSVANKQVSDLVSKAKAEKDPVKKQALLDQSRVISRDIEEKTNLFNQNISKLQGISGVSEREMGMSPEELALRRGAGQSAELASFVAPSLVGGLTASVGQRFLQAAGKGAIAGGLQGTAGASTESDNVIDAIGRIAGGTATGAVTGAAIQGVLETPQMAREWWNKTAKSLGPKAKEVWASTLKENIADQKFIRQYGGIEKVVDDATSGQIANTKNGVTNQLREFAKEYGDIIDNETTALQKAGKRINISRAYRNAEQKVIEEFGHDKTLLKQATNWLDSNKNYKKMTNALPKTANELRKQFDKKVGEVITSDAAPADYARKMFAGELRSEFKKLASDETKKAITKYHLLSGLSSAMRKEPIAGLAEGATAAATAAAGSLLGGPAALLSALGGYGASIAARSPGLRRTAAGAVIREAGREVPQVVRSAINASPVIAPGVAALQRLIDKENKSKQTTTRLP